MESKNQTPMEKLTKGYDKFIKGKELNKNGKQQFENTLKKTVKVRSVK